MAGSNGTETEVEVRDQRLDDTRWLEQESKKPRMAQWEIELFAWALAILLLVGIYTITTHILDWIKALRASQ